MERQFLKNLRTSGTAQPSADILYDGEIAVGMNPSKPRIWTKLTDDTIAEFVDKGEIVKDEKIISNSLTELNDNIEIISGVVVNKQDIITDISTIRSNALSGKNASDSLTGYTKVSDFNTLSGIVATTSESIEDIETIRVNAESGKTAYDSLSGYTTVEEIEDNEYVISNSLNNLNKTIVSVSGTVETKQDKLISGTNLKTVNNETLLGSGNIEIKGVTDYNQLENTPTIPSKTSDLTNDSNFISASTISGLIKNDGSIDTTDYAKSSEIPTKTSQLTNDSHYLQYTEETNVEDVSTDICKITKNDDGTVDITNGAVSASFINKDFVISEQFDLQMLIWQFVNIIKLQIEFWCDSTWYNFDGYIYALKDTYKSKTSGIEGGYNTSTGFFEYKVSLTNNTWNGFWDNNSSAYSKVREFGYTDLTIEEARNMVFKYKLSTRNMYGSYNKFNARINFLPIAYGILNQDNPISFLYDNSEKSLKTFSINFGAYVGRIQDAMNNCHNLEYIVGTVITNGNTELTGTSYNLKYAHIIFNNTYKTHNFSACPNLSYECLYDWIVQKKETVQTITLHADVYNKVFGDSGEWSDLNTLNSSFDYPITFVSA